jgi:hypothetical protein
MSNKKKIAVYLSTEEHEQLQKMLAHESLDSFPDLALRISKKSSEHLITKDDALFVSMQLRGAAANCTRVLRSVHATSEEKETAKKLKEEIYQLRENLQLATRSKSRVTAKVSSEEFFAIQSFLKSFGYKNFSSFLKQHFLKNGLLFPSFETKNQKLSFKRELQEVCAKIFSEVEFLSLDMPHKNLASLLQSAKGELERLSQKITGVKE